MSNFYTILNVSKTASETEIKQAFRKLSLQFHPDKNSQYESKYQEILNAYRTLENENSRRKYDQSTDITTLVENPIEHNTSTSMLDNQLYNRSYNKKPPSLTAHLTITLEQSYTGCQYPVGIERYIYEEDCRVREKENIYITIEPGIDNGEIIIIKNKGHEDMGGNIGDLKVFIHIGEHNLYKRQGLDIIFNKTISFKDSICGFSFNLPFLNGNSMCIRNAAGDIILNGAKKILRGKGMQRNNIIGNLTIEFTIIQPKKIAPSIVEDIKCLLIKNAQ
jgi:DnaJ homolog subfamily B member 4